MDSRTRYPQEVRERAVRIVFEHIEEQGTVLRALWNSKLAAGSAGLRNALVAFRHTSSHLTLLRRRSMKTLSIRRPRLSIEIFTPRGRRRAANSREVNSNPGCTADPRSPGMAPK